MVFKLLLLHTANNLIFLNCSMLVQLLNEHSHTAQCTVTVQYYSTVSAGFTGNFVAKLEIGKSKERSQVELRRRDGRGLTRPVVVNSRRAWVRLLGFGVASIAFLYFFSPLFFCPVFN